MHVETQDGQHVFEVQVYLDDVSADAVRVELYADSADGDRPALETMQRGHELARFPGRLCLLGIGARDAPGERLYGSRGSFQKSAPCVPLEADQILWQR